MDKITFNKKFVHFRENFLRYLQNQIFCAIINKYAIKKILIYRKEADNGRQDYQKRIRQ